MCKDQFEKCPVTGGPKGWCMPGHEAERDAARIALWQADQQATPTPTPPPPTASKQFGRHQLVAGRLVLQR